MMDKIMLTCKESTLLIEKRYKNEINIWDKIHLSAHLKMCKHCNLYARQTAILERILTRKPELLEEDLVKLKEKIKSKLEIQ